MTAVLTLSAISMDSRSDLPKVFVEARCEILTQLFLHFRFTMLQLWIGSSSAVSSTVLPQFWSLLEFTTLLRLVVGRGLVVRLRVEWMNLIPSLMKTMRMACSLTPPRPVPISVQDGWPELDALRFS